MVHRPDRTYPLDAAARAAGGEVMSEELKHCPCCGGEARERSPFTELPKPKAMIERLIGIGNALKNNTPFKSPTYGVTAHEWDMAVSDWQSMPSHVTNPLDSQGIVTRNGGEG